MRRRYFPEEFSWWSFEGRNPRPGIPVGTGKGGIGDSGPIRPPPILIENAKAG